MKIVKLDAPCPPSMKEIAVIHRDLEPLKWRISSRTPQADFDIFQEINEYWAQLPMETQDAIYNTYERASLIFNGTMSTDRLMDALRPLARDMFYLHPQTDLDYWVRTKSKLLVPNSIKRVFDPGAGYGTTKERTYVEEDYRQLVPLAISMRIMIPIWGEFNRRIESTTKTALRDYTAFKLLALSDVMDCPAMRRLAVYVRHTIPNDHSKSPAILYGIGTEDFPDWALAITVVNRLCRADVSGVGDTAQLIAFIFNYIREAPSMIDNQVGRVSDKEPDDAGGMDSNHSKIEKFRIKQQVAAGEIAMTTHYLRLTMKQLNNPGVAVPELALFNRLARHPDPNRSSNPGEFRRLIQAASRSTKSLKKDILNHVQVTLAGWVLAQYVPARSIPYLTKQSVLQMISIAQAYLWYYGHHDLAVIVSARTYRTSHQVERYMGDFKQRITQQQLVAISDAFPYMQRPTGSGRNTKSTMMVTNSIEAITRDMEEFDWENTLPDNWMTSIGQNPNNRRYSIPADIAPKLASLVLELDQRWRHQLAEQKV